MMREDWIEVELGELTENPKNDIVDGPFGSNLKSDEYVDSGIPVFKIQNIKANRFVDKNIHYVTPQKSEELKRHTFKKGDLIITKLGDPLGLCCKVPEKYEFGVIVADLIRFRSSDRIVFDNYLIYGINSILIQKQFKEITKGTTRPRVNLTIVRSLKFPLAPLPEQRAIAAKIEQLFSELDNGIANLKAAKSKLEIYHQAILKQAFEGKLTKYKNKIESDLPIDWKLVKIEDVCEVIGGKNQKNVENPNGKYPIYGSGGIFGYADDYLCESGTTVIGRKGTINSPIYVNQKFWNVDTAFGISPLSNINSKYIYYFCVGFDFRKLDKSTTIPSLAKRDILKISIPLAPIEEQSQIVQEIETRLSVCDKLNEAIDQSLEKAQALRQSILKKAFEGKLLSQDELQTCRQQPDWEPAAKLLERVKKDSKTK
jgi:type I restriction enzyme S subunit